MSSTEEHYRPELPGYRLTDLIGTGGCGEVWSAVAPGGIAKAVKCVYGQYNEKRAEGELRSLERIKSVRHPFLLSLERIEVSEGRLFVVTELGDGSLRDRMQQCIDQGLPGIPREELLVYIREAAEALDYLADDFDLQHLDIKPENLLLLAGHVKVADFGLVKQVESSQASLVGGLTPSYAAPEVYKGSPSRYSDQYSLAILYQEMLTGVLPYAGATVAELTLQHLHDEPNLQPLCDEDRFVVSQALAKEPAHRFENCRAFVDALSRATQDAAASDVQRPPVPLGSAHRPTRRNDLEMTQIFDDQAVSVASQIHLQIPAIDPPQYVEPEQAELSERSVEPTLVIGIGGTGQLIQRGFRRQMKRLLGSEKCEDLLRVLLIDTDASDIARATRPDDDLRGLRAEETLCAPLAPPQDYRDKTGRLLTWLSRRWLYNIPKSLRTDGLRPLGRLAFVDHARQIVQRIRMILIDLIEQANSHGDSAAERNASRVEQLHVHLVGSISGGTASGMLLDLAYAVRTLCQRLEVGDVQVSALVTHSTGCDQQRNELARVNSFAWIDEYTHFCSSSDGYPGDSSAGLPAHDADVAPFDRLHVVDLGGNLDESRLAHAASNLGDYLALATVYPLATAAASCPDQDKLISTLAVSEMPLADSAEADLQAAYAVQYLESAWLGETKHDVDADESSAAASVSTCPVVAGITRLVADEGLANIGMLSAVQKVLAACFDGASPLAVLRRKLAEQGLEKEQLTFEIGRQMVDDICEVAESAESKVTTRWDAALATVAEVKAAAVSNWLITQVAEPGRRLPAAEKALDQLQRDFGELDHHFQQQSSRCGQQLSATCDLANDDSGNDASERVVAYLKLRTEQLVARLAGKLVQLLIANLKPVAERLVQFRSVAREVFQRATSAVEPEQADAEQLMAARRIAQQVDNSLTESISDEPIIDWLLDGHGRTELPALIATAVDHEVRRHAVQQRLRQPLPVGTAGVPMPILSSHGGEMRYLAVLPCGVNVSAIVGDSLGSHVAKANCEHLDSAVLITEINGLSPLHVAASIVNRRRDYAEYAARAHCRCDVEWTSVLDQLQTDPPPITPDIAAPVVAVTSTIAS